MSVTLPSRLVLIILGSGDQLRYSRLRLRLRAPSPLMLKGLADVPVAGGSRQTCLLPEVTDPASRFCPFVFPR
jgi:hypothetical protein